MELTCRRYIVFQTSWFVILMFWWIVFWSVLTLKLYAAVLIHPKYHINNFLFSSASSCDEITKSLFSDRQADVVISNQWHLPIFWQTRFYVHVVISQTITPPLFFLQIFVVISKCLHFFWLKIFCSDITNNNASIFSDWQIFVVISQTIKPPYFLTDNNTSLFSDQTSFLYKWTSSSADVVISSVMELPFAVIRRGSLRGGSTYTITVTGEKSMLWDFCSN